MNLLEEKAAEGVEVRLLYDAFGSKGTKVHHLNELKKRWFCPNVYYFSKALLKFRLNYHDHRKIVVIDGKVGYIGGFNVADQYAGTTKKFGYWRDTHLRIQGPAASLLQMRFNGLERLFPEKIVWRINWIISLNLKHWCQRQIHPFR